MFAPENETERLLVVAATAPAERPRFLRALMEAQVFVVLLPVGGPLAIGPDGKLPAGTDLRLSTRGDSRAIEVFTTPSRARVAHREEHIVAPDTTRALFARFPGAPFVLNPGLDYSVAFTPEETARLLAGDLETGPRTVVIEQPTQVLLSVPTPYPHELTAALATLFATMPAIAAGFLAQVTFPGEAPHTLVGIDSESDWNALMRDLRPKLQSMLPSDRIVDFTPLAGSAFESYLRKLAPFYERHSPPEPRTLS